MKITEAEARRQIEARQPGENKLGGERFQITRKTYRPSSVKGEPPVLVTIDTGKFKPF